MRHHYRSSLSCFVLLALSTVALIATPASAQSSVSGANGVDLVDAKLLSVPKVKLPKEASVTGLGGKVKVRVSIDEKGNVTDGEASGPDYVCQDVRAPDVLALRTTAQAAALEAKFSPAMKGGKAVSSTMILSFNFPVSTPASAPAVGNGNGKSAGGKDSNSDESEPSKFGNADTPTLPTDQDAGHKSKKMSGQVLNGKALSLPAPPYPPAAKAVRAHGVVNIQVLILENGSVFSAEDISGHPLLRFAARNAACAARFTPTLLLGTPVKVSGIITYNFNL